MRKITVPLIVLLISCTMVKAALVKIYPTDDSYTDDKEKTANFNNYNLKAGNEVTRGLHRSYMKFDLSPLSNFTIASAKLKIEKVSTEETTVNLHYVSSDSWSETSLTWNNAPTNNANVASFVLTKAKGWYDFDVSSLINEPDKILSIVLKNNDEQGNVSALFYSKEMEEVYRPYLEVNVNAPDPVIKSITIPASINEGEKAAVSFTATNADKFNIYKNNKLVSNTSSYTWQTTFMDAGTYTYKFVATNTETSQYAEANKTLDVKNVETVAINEFYPWPNVNESEWIELYNPLSSDVNIAGCYIIDGVKNQWNLSKTIPSKKFGFFYINAGRLNDDGDLIAFYCNDLLHDQVIYGKANALWDPDDALNNAPVPVQGKSIGRYPDGKDTEKDNVDFQIMKLTMDKPNEKNCDDSDTNCNGCIEMSELLKYIGRWKANSNDVAMTKLLNAIKLWKTGVGC